MYTYLQHKIAESHPEWKEHHVKNTLLMVLLLLSKRTVNLWKLKDSISSCLGNDQTDVRSHYQRIKRWFWEGGQTPIWLAMLQYSFRLLSNKSEWLIVDGTSWQRGGKTVHFLTLSVLYQGVSVPVWWVELGHLGQSSQWHRRLLLRTAAKILCLSGKCLVGDREYIGTDWFATLKEQGLDMVIRLRKTDYLSQIDRRGRSVGKMEKQAAGNLHRPFWKKVEIAGQHYYFVLMAYGQRNGKPDYLRLLSTLPPAKAVAGYRIRYRIESMFKHLKSNGFDLEVINLKRDYKVRQMMALVVLSYTLAVVEGLTDFKKKIRLKKHGFPEKSVFRWGIAKWGKYLGSFKKFCRRAGTYLDKISKQENSLIHAHVP